jgi:hypothetical protein
MGLTMSMQSMLPITALTVAIGILSRSWATNSMTHVYADDLPLEGLP